MKQRWGCHQGSHKEATIFFISEGSTHVQKAEEKPGDWSKMCKSPIQWFQHGSSFLQFVQCMQIVHINGVLKTAPRPYLGGEETVEVFHSHA